MKYTKTCSKCKEVKPYSDFHKRKSRKIGISSHCKSCDYGRKKGYTKEENRAQKLKHRYNISIKEYEEMSINQGGVCKICKEKESYKRLSVDHCHITGRVRGLLCTNCNRGVGFFKDSLSLLQQAISYLREN